MSEQGNRGKDARGSRPASGRSSGRPTSGRSGGDRSDRPSGDRRSSSSSKPRSDKPHSDRPRSDRASDKPRSDKPRSDRPRSDRPSDKPRSDRPRSDRPRSDKPRSDRPRSDRASDKPRSDKPRSDRPRSDRASDKPRSDKPRSDRPRSDRPSDKPRSDRPRSDRPRDGRSLERRPAGRPSSDRSRSDRSRTDRPRPERVDRPRGPRIPDDVSAEDLDPQILNELRTLPEDLGEVVARHLVAADLAAIDGNTDIALEHARAAKRMAGRVASVREALGVACYLAGEYAEALNELRAVRRMRGGDDFVPMMADCERGLGRPEKAWDLLKSLPLGSLDPETRVEALLVMAGARADMGQIPAALVVLEVPDLKGLPAGSSRARLQYLYADLLLQDDQREAARLWFKAAMESDLDGETDAAERWAELQNEA